MSLLAFARQLAKHLREQVRLDEEGSVVVWAEAPIQLLFVPLPLTPALDRDVPLTQADLHQDRASVLVGREASRPPDRTHQLAREQNHGAALVVEESVVVQVIDAPRQAARQD